MIIANQTGIVSPGRRAVELFARMREAVSARTNEPPQTPKCPNPRRNKRSENPGNAIANSIPHDPSED